MNWYKLLKLSDVNNLKFSPHPHFNPDEDEIININPSKLDVDWKRSDPHFYIGQNGKGADFKYNDFGKWLNSNQGKSIQMPLVSLAQDGSIGFLDGRNRFSYLRDQGIKSMPVVVKKEHLPILKKYRS